MKALKFLLKSILFLCVAGIIFYGVYHHIGKLMDTETPSDSYTSRSTDAKPTPISRDAYTDVRSSLNQNNVLQFTDAASVENIKEIDIENLVNRILPSMVSIECTVTGTDYFGRPATGTSAGSGIYIETDDGILYLVTNQHVINGATSITAVFIDGESYPCELKAADSYYDLAILTIHSDTIKQSTLNSIVPAKLAENDTAQVGDMVIAVGNALGYGSSVTVGYVSATDHIYSEASRISLIQTDAAINPGNSGGALVNVDGEVIGINSSKMSSTKVESMGFAIPMKVAIPIIHDLQIRESIPEDEQGYLGIYITAISAEDAQLLNWPEGIYINAFVEGSAAAESDLKVGDIIVAVNDVPVATTEQLQTRINSYRYGTTVTLTVMRSENGVFEEYKIEVTLKEKSL